jgi:hypothetical protein
VCFASGSGRTTPASPSRSSPPPAAFSIRGRDDDADGADGLGNDEDGGNNGGADGGGDDPDDRMYTATHAAISPTSQLATPYRASHYAEYPMSAEERSRAHNEAQQGYAAADRAAALAAAAEDAEPNASQARMLQGQLDSSGGLRGDMESGRAGGGGGGGGAGGSGGVGALPGSHIYSTLELEESDEHEVVYAFPWKTAVIALGLSLLGLVCLILGVVHVSTGKKGSFAFILIGSLLVIPGGYQSYNLYHAWRGTPGFSFSQLVTFEGR